MDDAVAAKEEAAAVSTANFYPRDLVSYQSVYGVANVHTWACPPADEFVINTAEGTRVTKKAGDTDVALLDRSYLHAGQMVVSASDVGGQIGVVTGVTTVIDLVELNDNDDSGEEKKIVVRGVQPSGLRRIRALSLGDYVVSAGTWLGRVVEVSLDVDVVFDDGAMCRVSDAGSKVHPWVKVPRYYRPQENPGFYPGMSVRVITSGAKDFFRGSQWLKGQMKVDGEEGRVARVEMAGVLVRWIASPHLGTDQQQLVQESAPPAYQNPDNLTFFCSDSSCYWAVGDRCFLRESSLTLTTGATSEINLVGADACSSQFRDDSSSDDGEHDESSTQSSTTDVAKTELDERHYYSTWSSAPLSTMAVSNTHTTVDVLWQDGTRQQGAPSTSLNPFIILNDDEVFPGQYVLDATVDITSDDGMGVSYKHGSTRRTGVVKSVCSKDRTVNVSWFKEASNPDESKKWEAEFEDTVSAYDLEKDHEHSVFYGDVVVRLEQNDSQSTPPQDHEEPIATSCNKKSAPADLSWVGRVIDLHGGHVQVKWGDGSTSAVLPHEIGVANKEYYEDLQAEMGVILSVEEDNVVDAPQELVSATTDNEPHDPTDHRNVEGAGVGGGDGSMNKLAGSTATRTHRLGGLIQTMILEAVKVFVRCKWYLVNWSSLSASYLFQPTKNVEVASNQQDPSIVGAATEARFSPVTRSDASFDDAGSAEDIAKARETTFNGDPSNFPHFYVVQSPSDHHYLDTMDQGSSGGKTWVKAVQREWKILENSLPETIYVRAFEDRMDLLRVAMVGASVTPYQDGLFFFDLHLPPSYPEVPPQVYYHSFGLRLNPNLNESGTVCLSLLDTFGGEDTELWSPGTSSLLQVVVSIQALVLNHKPFYNEDGYEALVDKPEGHHNTLPYNENVFLLTLRTTLHVLRRPPKGFEGFIRDHFRRRGSSMLEICGAYLQGRVPDEGGGMELPCSAGFRMTLANIVPKLTATFTKIGAEGCDCCPVTTVL